MTAASDTLISDGAAIGVDVLRLGWGSLLLFAPDTALRAAGVGTSALARGISRTLGTRHVLSVLAIGSMRLAGRRGPSRSVEALVRRVVAGVDGAHAATAIAFAAATDEPRTWLLDALIAAAFAAGTLSTAT